MVEYLQLLFCAWKRSVRNNPAHLDSEYQSFSLNRTRITIYHEYLYQIFEYNRYLDCSTY